MLVNEIYDKIVFLSREAEREWNDAPEGVKKLRNSLLKHNIAQVQCKIQEEMEAKMISESENHCIEFWRNKAVEYEWLFLEQKNISDGYREIIQEQESIIKDLKLKK